MDGSLIFEKTADGEAAVTQRTRLVQRNLRTVLIMVDGASSVAALAAEIGNAGLVDEALRQLLDEGLIRARPVPEDLEVAAAERQAIHPAVAAPVPAPVASTPNPFAVSPPAAPRAEIQDAADEEPVTAAHFKPVDVAALASAKVVVKRRMGPAAIGGAIVGLLGLAFALLLMLHSAEQHRAAATAALAGAFGGNVSIGSLATSGLPPTLVMRDVVIDVDKAQAQIDEIRADLGLGVLFGAAARPGVLILRGARVDVGLLAAMANRREGAGTVQRVRLTGASIRIGDVAWADLSGEITFGPDGTLVRAAFQDGDGDGHWLAELTPAGGGAQLSLAAGPLKGVPDKASVIESARFVGRLDAGGYRIDQIDLRMFDGLIEGQADLDWRNGWRLGGRLSVKQADLARVAAGFGSPLRVEGRANAALQLTAAAAAPGGLWAASQGEGSMEVGGGRVHGVDLVDAVRRAGGRGPIAGGETRFDSLTASPRWRSGVLELLDLRLGAGLMSASGAMRMGEAGLSGAINVSVGGSAARIGGTLALTGTARDPAVRRQ